MAGTYVNGTNFAGALKELYDGQPILDLVYKKNPALSMVKKKTDFQGKYKPVPMIYATPQGRSANFSSAQANQTGMGIAEFLLTRKFDYAVGTITGEMAYAAKTDLGAFLSAQKGMIDGVWKGAANSLASAMYRGGTGSISTIGTISTGVITLATPQDIVQFEVGMTIDAAATDGAAPRAAVGYIIAVNRNAGTVTVSATSITGSAGSPASWAPGDFLLVDGDSNGKMSGFQYWLPTTAPTGGVLAYGVDRVVDSRLYGTLVSSSTGESIEEALVDAAVQLGLNGSSPDTVFINYISYGALLKALGTRKISTQADTEVGISFKGIELETVTGSVTVIPDRNCPAKTAFMLQLDTWSLDSAGDAPQILEDIDGNVLLRTGSADAYELRIGSYHNLECQAPIWNAQIQLNA